MLISRRRFLALLGTSSVAVGCAGSALDRNGAILGGGGSGGEGGDGAGGDGATGAGGGPTNPNGVIGPTGVTNKILWLQGTACSGCSISLLNRLAENEEPETIEDVLLEVVLLGYHPSLMVASGELAAEQAEALYQEGSYLLVVEGGIPTAFDGAACHVWTVDGEELSFVDAVARFAERAAAVMAVGTCAAYGGVPATGPNPAGVRAVRDVLERTVLNIPGCPTHPDWVVWALSQLIDQQSISIDQEGRPFELFGIRMHDRCPRLHAGEAHEIGVDGLCVQPLGCRGQTCWAPCSVHLWNHGVNWCVAANAICIGCTEPSFPEVGLTDSIAGPSH